jgi:hypothetical protein
MENLAHQILLFAKQLPEGAALATKSLLHLGTRGAVDQALSRLVAEKKLIRAARGVYFVPVTSRFGSRPPSVAQAVAAIAAHRGEVIVAGGAAAANSLGLTTQVPIRQVYWTSGKTRDVRLGEQVVELKHAPRWQLTMPDKEAGHAVRALAWVGPDGAETALRKLKDRLPNEVFSELVKVIPQLPPWLAGSVGKVAYG